MSTSESSCAPNGVATPNLRASGAVQAVADHRADQQQRAEPGVAAEGDQHRTRTEHQTGDRRGRDQAELDFLRATV
ncbi:hypothetical protein [Fodinicola feengrottensis]|uniref:hypothetical protein n=1 Tax=Fodinicola feengrottensis TaxID=435914 RepID=UPI0024436DEF|nr:hypothetical protein [Fodinicola feengrottensis]